MRALAGLVALAATTASAQAPSVDAIRQKDLKMLVDLFRGSFSNEEQVYFQGETGQKKDPRVSIDIVPSSAGATVDFRDAAGAPMFPPITVAYSVKNDGVQIASRTCTNHYQFRGDRFVLDEAQSSCSWRGARFVSISQHNLTMREPDGRMIEYRRARPYTCWISAPKLAKKADGSTDWFFKNELKLHDQGGRIWVETDEATPQKIGFKLRNVVWPYGSNKPALTLYAYKSDDPEKAVSYAWADPEAKLIGINLRWMQGSCSRDLEK
jgi:hypothetical protein